MPGGRRVVIEFVGQDNAGKAVGKVIGQLESVKNRLQALNRASTDPQVDADTVEAVTKIKDLTARLDFLRKQKPTVDVVAKINDAMLRLEEVNAAARDLDGRRVNINVDVDTAGARIQLDRLRAKLTGFGSDLAKASQNLRFVGVFLKNPFALLAAIPVAVDGASALLDVSLSLGTALGAAVGGAVALKLALSNLHLTKAGREFKHFEGRLQQIKKSFQATAQRNILPGLQQGIMSAFGGLGAHLKRAWSSITRGLGAEFKRFGRQIGNDPNIKKFIDNVGRAAPAAFRHLGSIAKSVLDIVLKLFNSFAPGKGKSDPLASLSKSLQRFNRWLNPGRVEAFNKAIRGNARDLGTVVHVIASVVRWYQRLSKASGQVPAAGQAWNKLKSIVSHAWSGIKSVTSRGMAAVKGVISRGGASNQAVTARQMAAIRGVVSHGWRLVSSATSHAWSAIRGAVSRGAAAVRSAMSHAWSVIVSTISHAWSQIVSAVQSGANRVVSFVRSIPGRIVAALGGLGGMLAAAGRSAMSGLLSGISSGASAVYAKVRSVASGIAAAAMGALKSHSPSLVFVRIGHSIMDGLIVGMEHRRIRLGRALSRILADIKRHGEKLKTLLSAKQGVISAFRGMPGSVFSQDLNVTTTSANGVERTRRATAHSMVAFQQQQAHQAQRLARDIRKLRREGISDNLLRQMVDAGESGWANIHTLAQGSRGQVHALNRANAATAAALTRAGRGVGTELYQPRIHDQRTDIRVAKHLEHALERVLKHHDKRIVIELHVDGRHLHTALLRHKRKRGRSLRLG